MLGEITFVKHVLALAAILAITPPAFAATAAEQANPNNDPCRYVEPAEAAGALGNSLSAPPYRTSSGNFLGNPDPSGNTCVYLTSDLQSIRVQVSLTGGGQMLQLMGQVQGAIEGETHRKIKLSTGAEVAGEWDEARVFERWDLLALLGDSLVSVDVGGSAASMESAIKLTNLILLRLDTPLAIDGGANADPATVALASRPAQRDVCQLISKADFETGLGVKLEGEAQSGDGICTYDFYNSAGRPDSVEFKVKWAGGFWEFRHDPETMASAIGVDGTAPALDAGPGPWVMAAATKWKFYAVAKNVFLEIDIPKNSREAIEKLVADALVKL